MAQIESSGAFGPAIWLRPVGLTEIHIGFNLRARVSFQVTETLNSHLTLVLVSFYISGLRKDWISHLIKRDCTACCFLSCSFSLVHRQLFILMLSPIPDTRSLRNRQELGSYKTERWTLSHLSRHKQIFPLVPTSASALSTLCSLTEQSLRIDDHFQC